MNIFGYQLHELFQFYERFKYIVSYFMADLYHVFAFQVIFGIFVPLVLLLYGFFVECYMLLLFIFYIICTFELCINKLLFYYFGFDYLFYSVSFGGNLLIIDILALFLFLLLFLLHLQQFVSYLFLQVVYYFYNVSGLYVFILVFLQALYSLQMLEYLIVGAIHEEVREFLRKFLAYFLHIMPIMILIIGRK